MRDICLQLWQNQAYLSFHSSKPQHFVKLACGFSDAKKASLALAESPDSEKKLD